jgi:hypothetical protein
LSVAVTARLTVVSADAVAVFNTGITPRRADLGARAPTSPAFTALTASTAGGAAKAFAIEAGRRRAGLAATAGSGFLAGVMQAAPAAYFLAVFVAFLAATFLAGADLAAGADLLAAAFLAGAAFFAGAFFAAAFFVVAMINFPSRS